MEAGSVGCDVPKQLPFQALVGVLVNSHCQLRVLVEVFQKLSLLLGVFGKLPLSTISGSFLKTLTYWELFKNSHYQLRVLVGVAEKLSLTDIY